MAEALYRKYRPQIFEDVVGQEHIERTIKNAIEQDKVSHAYLFTGPRGTGKTTTARLLAKALLCDLGPTPKPDGTCSNCEEIAKGTHPDVYELDAASRTGVENVREEIIGRVQFAPTRGRYKVYIIDEVHMLSTAAFNALLKTLEEPPSHVVFILCTTDPQKVPDTIHSRCQRFDFRRISSEAIVSRLGAICIAEDVEFEGAALELIAYRAEGGLRNALTSLEQLIAFSEGKVTLSVAERLLGSLDTNDMAEIVTAIGVRDIAACFVWTANYIETGSDLAQFTRDLSERVRNMYVLTLAGTDAALEINDATRSELAKEMELFAPDRLARLLSVLGDLAAELRTSTNPRLSFEIALTRMIRPDSDLTLESLAERIEALESGYSAVAHVMTSPVAASSGVQLPPAASGATQAVAGANFVDAAVSSRVQETPPTGSSVVIDPSTNREVQGYSAEASPSSAEGASAQPQPVAAVGFDNPAALQRIWQAALAMVKKNKAAYGVLFLNTRAVGDPATGEMVIEFPAENAFAYTAVQKPEVTEVVQAALAQAAGTSVPFRYGKADSSRASGAGVAPVPAPSSAQEQSRPATPAASFTQAEPPRAQASATTSVAASFEAPEPESIPLDAYDGYPVAESEPARTGSLASTASQSHTAHIPASTGASAPTANAPAPDEMESILAAGFGDGVQFKEVD